MSVGAHTSLGLGRRPSFKYGKDSWLDGEEKICTDCQDHGETAAHGVYHIILYNLLCFASVPVFIFGGATRKVARINYQNPIMESCHGSILQ